MKRNSIYRFAGLLFLVSLLLGTNPLVLAAGQSASTPASALTFNPAADAYVVQTSASTNYGTGVSLRLDASPDTRSYLRFVVSGLNGAAVQTALLRIYANSANTAGFSVQAVSNNTWVENGITCSNAPAAGAAINSSIAFAAGTWVEVDLSSYVKAAGTFSLMLSSTSSTNTNLASREDATHAPQLVVTTSAGSGLPTATPHRPPRP